MAKCFYVDIPIPECVDDGGGWVCMAKFATKQEAVVFIRENIDPDCDDDGKCCLISIGEDV